MSPLELSYHNQTLENCEKNSRLHHALKTILGQGTSWAHLSHLTTCIWMVAAVIQSREVNLTKWLPYLPCRGKYAQSKQRRVRRWLGNNRINVHRLYKPIIKAALADWQDEMMYLSLDTSLYWDEYCLIRLAVVHRGRALPLSWRVLAHPSASVSANACRELLQDAAKLLPERVKVVLLADRGFVHTDTMTLVKTFGWHYRIRCKSNTWFWRSTRGWSQLNSFAIQPGQAFCWHNVRLHKGQQYGPVHVIFGRNNVNGQFWAVISDEPTNLQTFAEYGLRFDIEEAFRDDQSGGWQLQSSKLRSVCVLSRLFFVLALATLYVTAQGLDVVHSRRRRWVDPHWFRGNSYFRLGLEWIRSALLQGWPLVRRVAFLTNSDPDPAMASRSQHRRCSDRLEFQVYSSSYFPD